MAIGGKTVCFVVVRLILTVFALIVCLLVASLGGLLNRCRGGYLNYTAAHLDYWPAHILSRQTFSLSTGILVLILGVHLRAGVVVWLLTQWSLFVGWGTYMSIGEDSDNYESRAGIFDWMLGRQEEGWNFTHRFIREYSGMSLRGLIWTAPQGYALQYLGFGWQYSLSGSLMSIFYFSGLKMQAFGGNVGHILDGPEFYWGTFVWLVLIMSCVSQFVYRSRQWVHYRSKDSYGGNGINPNDSYQVLLYQSLNRITTNVIYNASFVVFWLVLCASTVFYSLIIQTDIRNKGQTFFGLFMSVLTLTIFMCWTWSASFTSWLSNKEQKKFKKSQNNNLFPASRINYLEQRGMPGLHPSETDRLLPTYSNWPYSHPDKGYGEPRPHAPSPVGFSQTSPHALPRNHHNHTPPLTQISHAHQFLMKVWLFIDKWFYMDIFVLIRHLIGVLSIVSVLVTVGLSIYTVVWAMNVNAPVFDPQYFVCTKNHTDWDNDIFIP